MFGEEMYWTYIFKDQGFIYVFCWVTTDLIQVFTLKKMAGDVAGQETHIID